VGKAVVYRRGNHHEVLPTDLDDVSAGDYLLSIVLLGSTREVIMKAKLGRLSGVTTQRRTGCDFDHDRCLRRP
jgi:hypothetical protein